MAPVEVETPEALLDAAERLFAEHGYAAVGIREISEAAGANIAAIKYHFGSKSDLYIACVRRAMERHGARAAWQVLEGPHASRRAAAAALALFIRRFLARRLPPPGDGPDVAGSLILHEAAEPSEAIDSVVRDFIRPHESMLVETLSVLAPEAQRRTLALHAQSIMGQMLHYRVFRPFMERMAVGDLSRPATVRRIADHIARVSLRGLGLSEARIERALTEAQTSETSTGTERRTPR